MKVRKIRTTRARKGRTTCLAPRCDRRARAAGYCHRHFKSAAQESHFDSPLSRGPRRDDVRLQDGKLLFDDVSLRVETFQNIKNLAVRQGLTPSEMASEILETWAEREATIRQVLRLSGLNLKPEAGLFIAQIARSRGLGIKAVITEIIESWARRQHGNRPRSPSA